MTFQFSDIKSDQVSKSLFYNRIADSYAQVPAGHTFGELMPMLEDKITPIALTDQIDRLSGAEFSSKVVVDTPVFRWCGEANYFRKREADRDDIGTLDRAAISLALAEVAINEATEELFGASIADEIYGSLRYSDKQRIIYSRQIKVYFSDLRYRLTFSQTSDWED